MPPTDRVAFIAGATGALGRAVASAFAADGLRLGLGGTDAGRLAAVASDLRLADDRWAAGVGNVSTADGAQAAARAVTERFGRIDILVHAVGGFEAGTPLVDVAPEGVQTQLDQHVWSTIHLVGATVPGMAERGWGRVVAVATAAAVNAPAGSGPYAAAKGAQEILLRSLAKEVGGRGVTVNLVAVRAI
ncbi:MAG TPA: SDR family NAD(P)-dependent oxidoreductase, partial [Candidatus Limnocylindrales bacterium]|nr:SDR family NAD(P)-dependent oxidoreductase [Candidatus Limnocylindrales bacterium]